MSIIDGEETALTTVSVPGQKPQPLAPVCLPYSPEFAPGPVGAGTGDPGRESLEAVANPSKTGDLYFVADGTGGHVFAATLDEHNENVARWRAIQKKQVAKAS